MPDNSAEESRTTLVAALTDAGLNVQWSVGERTGSPAGLVEPGDPWIERSSVGGSVKQINWRVIIFAAKAEQNVAVHDLTQGALIAIRVIDGMAGWSGSNVTGYRAVPDTPEFIAVELATSSHIEVTET